MEKRSSIVLAIIVIFSLTILYRARLFEDNIIVNQDYPFHFYRVSILTYDLLPKFQNIIGWIKYFQAGMLEFYDYPPLPYLITSALYYLTFGNISLTLLFRITIAIAFILPIIGIYCFTKSLNFKTIIALISSLLWLAFLHDQFIAGNYTTYFSIGFAFLGLAFYHNYLNKKGKSDMFFVSILFSATFLSNPMIFVPLCFYLLFTLKNLSKKDFCILIISFLGISFIWFVQIFTGIEYISSIHPLGLSIHPEWYDVYYIFFNHFVYLTPATFFLIFIGLILEIKNKIIFNFLSFIVIVIIFLVTVEQLQKTFSFFSLFQPEKTIIFLRGFMIILSVYFSFSFFEKNHLKNKNLVSILKSLIATAIIMSSITYIPYLFFGWSDPMGIFTKQVRGFNPPFDLREGFFAYQPKESTIEVFDWIRKNTDNSSRVLFEDSNEGYLGGYILAMAPFYTGRNFIGGPFVHMMLADQGANAFNGIIMGKNISYFEIEEFEEKLMKFNVEYVVAWTKDFVSFLNNHSVFQLKFIDSSKFLHIYHYKGAVRSYAEINNSFASIETIEFENNKMVFKIFNSTIKDKIYIKSTFNPHWKARVENKEVKLEKDNLHLISLTSPQGGNYVLTLEFKNNLLEIFAPFISLFSFVSIVLYIVYLKLRRL